MLRACRRLGSVDSEEKGRAQFEDVLNMTVPLGVTYGYLSLFTCPLNYLRASQALLREEPGSLGPDDIMLFNIRGKNIPVCMGSIPHCVPWGATTPMFSEARFNTFLHGSRTLLISPATLSWLVLSPFGLGVKGTLQMSLCSRC